MDGTGKQEIALRPLLEGLLEDDLSTEQHHQLCEELSSSDEALASYVDYLHLHASLNWELAEETDDDPALKPVWLAGDVERAVGELDDICRNAGLIQQHHAPETRGKSAGRRNSWLGHPALLAASILLAVGAVLAYVWQAAMRSDSESASIVNQVAEDTLNAPAPIAVLTSASDAVWEDSLSLHRGQSLKPRVMTLTAGIAQVDFFSGASVVLEGPAKLELVSDMRCNLSHGKLRARVPRPARGFTVGTEQFDVVDLGTEFAVRLGQNSLPEVHVIEGEVELRAASSDSSSLPLGGTGAVKKLLKRLRKGNGVRIGPNAELVPIRVDADSFVGPDQLASLSLATSKQRVAEWISYSDRWSKDADVVAYYIFERRNERTRALKNLGPNRPKRLDGAIVGCEWATGRWPDKGALSFARDIDSVRLVAEGEFDSLSFAAWVRIDALPNRLNALVLTDAFDTSEVHWQITALGELELSVRYGDTGPASDHDFRSPKLIRRDRFGQWLFLVSVYDQQAGVVSHYIDGKNVSQEEMPVRFPVRIGDALIGNWDPARKQPKAGNRERAFKGRIDELLIIAKPLSPDEIAAMYAAGLP